ncbi:MAG TPA: heavy metal translocating P-type ATPase [Candidatus Anaerobiospirillum stercoravium]|nr:heavy metal translocating P-type ATPase [Candidatus Anaerobiospirillum stercoravium]
MGMLAAMSLHLKLRLGAGLVTMLLLLSGAISDIFAQIVLTGVVYLWVSYPVLKSAWRDLVVRHRMSEQFLMTVATFGALGLQDFAEALAVMVFYLVGDAFEDYAAQRSHNEIASLVKLKPSKVRLLHDDGSEELVAPRKVKLGQRIRVLAGEVVALDGALVGPSASVDMSALTGESEPALFTMGQEVPSGVINMGQVIELTVTRDNKSSSITRLINLIEDAAANKSRPEALITRFAVYYTPIVVGAAVLLTLVGLLPGQDFSDWLTRALVFLVVSCPCALVLSVPLSFFGGLGAISKTGVMVKGSIHIEALSKLKAIALDKTGTITQGKFAVSKIECFVPERYSEPELLSALYALERLTTHPIGMAIVKYCEEQGLALPEATDVQEITGFGLQGKVDGKQVAVGKERLITDKLGLKLPQQATGSALSGTKVVGTELYVVIDGELVGRVTLADSVKDSALPFFDAMHDLGIKTYMITGDKKEVAASIAQQCHISAFYAEQLPEDKLDTFKSIKSKDGVVAYVGDGINDAPTLAASDVGIAMGQFGSAAAVEAADVVVMNDDLTKIPTTIKLAQQTYHLAQQNMVFVIAVKALILLLGALGYANIWMAILGDVGLCVLAVLNAMRPLSWVKTKSLAETAGAPESA